MRVYLGRSTLTCQGFGQLLEESSAHFLALLLEAGAGQPAGHRAPRAQASFSDRTSTTPARVRWSIPQCLACLLRGSTWSVPDGIFSTNEALGGKGGPDSGEGTGPLLVAAVGLHMLVATDRVEQRRRCL